jgi:hypothetical protein
LHNIEAENSERGEERCKYCIRIIALRITYKLQTVISSQG